MRRPELDAVFRHYSSNGSVLSIAELRDFLGDQGEDASLNHAQNLILTYELNERAQKKSFMTQDGFTMYMLSMENDVFNPDHCRIYQDMTRPLAHYFISSSHNTYLTKDQITSTSSTEPYIRAAAVWSWIAGMEIKASPYPLILSFENHCSVEQQAVMAKHLHTILGKKLLAKPLSDLPLKELPSPEVHNPTHTAEFFQNLSGCLVF
ncbi:1-phosphatidylinositol 4 5-bisphosphate phosphodiesterase delta-3-A [Xenoophorus captivus]|uniref:1-phosphatidylinositol 4 5-bisphosphate phosphodiesterase delta-3-A n=1 Tax=Xenoophorus captivus TaxID=1517983 RepID=A0ABV0S428_9TELE